MGNVDVKLLNPCDHANTLPIVIAVFLLLLVLALGQRRVCLEYLVLREPLVEEDKQRSGGHAQPHH